MLVDALVDAGGELPVSDLVGLGGRSRFTVAGAGRLASLDLVSVDGDTVTPVKIGKRGSTPLRNNALAGNRRRRLVRDAVATIAGCEQREDMAKRGGTPRRTGAQGAKARAERGLQRFAPLGWRYNYAPSPPIR